MKKLIQKGKYEFRNRYFADSNGHIWSENKQNYLKEYDDKNGYKKVVLMTMDKPLSKGHRFSVHRLIMETFYPVSNMINLQVDHINGNNQDNRLENLRWATVAENLNNENTKPNRRVYDQDGTHNASAKFDKNSLLQLIIDINSGQFKRNELLEKYNICYTTLRKIINKETYNEELKDIEIKPKFVPDMIRDTNGEKNGKSKLNNEKVLQIIKLLQTKKYSYQEIGRMYGVSDSAISNIKNKKTWKHLTKNINFN